jgi:hypothetical protein
MSFNLSICFDSIKCRVDIYVNEMPVLTYLVLRALVDKASFEPAVQNWEWKVEEYLEAEGDRTT